MSSTLNTLTPHYRTNGRPAMLPRVANPLKLINTVTNEQRLYFKVALQALVESDPAQVMTRSSDTARSAIAAEAQQFVAGEDFTMYCNLAAVSPSLMRSLSPQAAKQALRRLSSMEQGHGEHNDAASPMPPPYPLPDDDDDTEPIVMPMPERRSEVII